jgi:phage I-like protein
MSDIQEEAYTEVCAENERLRGLLEKVDVSVEKLNYCKALCARAADALETSSPLIGAEEDTDKLIAELRKAAE